MRHGGIKLGWGLALALSLGCIEAESGDADEGCGEACPPGELCRGDRCVLSNDGAVEVDATPEVDAALAPPDAAPDVTAPAADQGPEPAPDQGPEPDMTPPQPDAAPDQGLEPDMEPPRCEPQPELCNGRDDDCDGLTDEGTALECYMGPPGTENVGPCRGGLSECFNGGFSPCEDQVLPAAEETCEDGVDDDCDGQADEGCGCVDGSVRPCGSAVGACEEGEQLCVNREWGPCEGDVGPEPEACNGADDDCDGRADELLVPRPCYTGDPETEDVGRCEGGLQACVEGRFDGPCEGEVLPAPEDLCDGEDADCDGVADEDHVDTPVVCGLGICAADGVQLCVNGTLGRNCIPGDPEPEQCNLLDDDCDGVTDEDAPGDPCYEGPEGTEGVGVCQGGNRACIDGEFVELCADQVLPAEVDLCNGLDDDCDGTVDEDHVDQPTACGQGVCAAEGVLTCVEGAEVDTCVEGEPANFEICNALDDDCDGTVDEEHVAPCYEADPATQGVGPCRGGAFACVDGRLGDECVGQVLPAQVDLCNDVDDDCDAATDEDHEEAETACGVGECAAFGVLACQSGEVVDTCAEGQPDVRDLCDGLDEDCDAEVDEDAAEPIESVCGVGACNARGVLVCADGVPDDSCVPGEPGIEELGEVDDDCDGRVDEGFPFEVEQLQDLFDRECTRCHFFLRGDFRDGTVDQPSASRLDLVEPGDHQQSYLYHKLAGTHLEVLGGRGRQMPIGGTPWDDYQLGRLAAWIDALEPVED